MRAQVRATGVGRGCLRGGGGAQRLVKGRRARPRDADRVLGGAHPKHVEHAEFIRARLYIRDAGHIEAQRLVERRRKLPIDTRDFKYGAKCAAALKQRPGGGADWRFGAGLCGL